MSNFTDFFPAAGGGGGGIPKYQEFTSSGTFTPTQALIDAGGRLTYFIVGGGGQGDDQGGSDYGGGGGGVTYGYMTLTSTNGCAVVIGAAGGKLAAGGASSIAFSSAGGTDISITGAYIQYGVYYQQRESLGANYANHYVSSVPRGVQGIGLFGYGSAGSPENNGIQGGVTTPVPNSGQGSPENVTAADGFLRLTWFE